MGPLLARRSPHGKSRSIINYNLPQPTARNCYEIIKSKTYMWPTTTTCNYLHRNDGISIVFFFLLIYLFRPRCNRNYII